MIYRSEMNKLRQDLKELPKVVNKSELTEWFLGKQRINKQYCSQASVLEIINAAEKCGIKVKC